MTDPLPAGPALIRAATLVGDLYAQAAEAAGVTVQQARLLFVLHHRSESMLGLGAVLRVGKSTMTGVVERMAAAGLVTRGSDPEDRRRQAVTLTATGEHAADVFEAALSRAVEQLLDGTSARDRASIGRILSRVVARGDALGDSVRLSE